MGRKLRPDLVKIKDASGVEDGGIEKLRVQDQDTKELLTNILLQLRVMNQYLSIMIDDVITDEDIK